jgi:hypothetical protein
VGWRPLLPKICCCSVFGHNHGLIVTENKIPIKKFGTMPIKPKVIGNNTKHIISCAFYKEVSWVLRMKRKIAILLFCILFISISCEPVDRTKAFIRTSNLHVSKPILENNNIISHAMGEIDGHYYTNSLEAFQYSYYNKGSRVFEVDFELTLEGILVARHDWRLIYAEQLMQTPETPIDNRPWHMTIS